MPATPAAGSWLALLFNGAARKSAGVVPLKASLNLSTTIPQTTPPTENFQTEISAVVVVGGNRYTVSSGGGPTLQVSRSTNPAVVAPSLLQRLNYGSAVTTTTPATVLPNGASWVSQSVARFNNLVAVALSPSDYGTKGGRGIVRFYQMAADGSLTFMRDVVVGYLPDSIAFNSIGTMLVVANEGEPTTNYEIDGTPVDRPGSIGIIDIRARYTYTDLTFDQASLGSVVLPAGVRITGKSGLSTQATDIEPEHVSVLGTRYAYVTLQENNAVARVDLATKKIDRIFDLGTVDFSQLLVDINDRDGANNTTLIKPVFGNNVRGMRMADGISAFSTEGNGRLETFFMTANEGDGREYGTYLDEERRNTGLSSRLKTLKEIVAPAPLTAFGSRSASLFNADNGQLVWDSGNSFQTLAIAANVYDDLRSDDKGTEPEGVVVHQLNGRTYAIVGMERTTRSMLVVFDVTNPPAVTFVSSIVLPDSVSPEGLFVLDAASSPNGRPLVVVSNELSNTLDYLDLETLVQSTGVATAGAYTPTMLKDVAGGDTLQISSLITTGEVTNGLQAGSSVFAGVGIVDGMGAYDNGDGTYSLLVNHEIGSADGYQYRVQVKAGSSAATTATLTGARISRFVVAKDIDNNSANGFQSRVLAGGLAYDEVISPNSGFTITTGFTRFCSANLAPAAQFGSGRGFANSLYLAGEETTNGRFFALDSASAKLYHVPAFGLGGWESATAVDTGNANTVGVMLFDDQSGTANYLYLWVGTKAAGSSDLLERNGIAASSGSLYAWKASTIANTAAGVAGVALNTPIAGSWVALGTGTEIAALSTAAALRTLATNAGAMQFTRIEDGDVNPGNGQQVAFNTTGGSGTDLYGNTQIIDLGASFNSNGLISTTGTASLRVISDADRLTGVARQGGVRNPDNLTWSANGYLYVQEDRSLPNGTADGSFGAEEASIWKIDTITGASTRWSQIDRSSVPTVYGQSDSATTDIGNWESSGIIDVSSLYDAAAGSYFLADVQAHSLINGNLVGAHYLSEGGQIDLIRVLPS